MKEAKKNIILGSFSTAAAIKTKLERITIEPKNALVFLVKDGKYLVGAALLSEKCALAPSFFLRDYIKMKLKTDNLFVGTGKPFEKYHEKDLHIVNEVMGESEIMDISYYYALVIFEVNKYGFPSHSQYIPISTTNYKQTHPIEEELVTETAVGWDRKKKEDDFYNQLHISSIYVNAVINIVMTMRDFGQQDDFIGGIMTRKGTLAGIAIHVFVTTGLLDNVTMMFLRVHSETILMEKAADDLFHVPAISEGSNPKLRKNLKFDEDQLALLIKKCIIKA